MHIEVVRLWTDNLISGKYPQGKYFLRNTRNGYCCFGVLCDLYIQEVGEGGWLLDRFTSQIGYNFAINGLSYGVFPPPKVLDWVGIKSSRYNYYPAETLVGYLADMNDNDRTFEEIAASILEMESLK